MSELEYRSARDDDRAAILELLRRSLGREVDDRYQALFSWKHEENAFGPSPAWVACDGDRLAGVRVLMRWEFLDGGRVVRAVRAVDTATDPDYQGRGIFTRLTLHAIDELAAEGVEFVFNTPNDQSRPGYLKMGWEVVGRLPTLVRPTRWRSIGRIAQARVPAERWSTPSSAGADARAVLADATGLDALLARLGGPRPRAAGIRTHVTAAFLRWRYGTPLLGYRAVTAPGGPQDGVAFFRVRARGAAREVALGAVLVPGDDRRAAGRLVRAVARSADADYVLAIGRDRIGPGGLVRLPRVGPLLTHRAVATTAKPSGWDLTLGDIELF